MTRWSYAKWPYANTLNSPFSENFFSDCHCVAWQNLSTDWQMTSFFLLALAAMGIAMKVVAYARSQRSKISSRSAQFIFSPLLAPNSLERSQPFSAASTFLRRAGANLVGLLLYYWIYWQVVNAFQLHGIILNYLAVPAVVFVGEVLVAIATILWLPSGRLLPVLHRNPFAARSVADFWGRRWNLWMSDWFRYAIFTPLRRRPVLASWMIFFLSGILHEYVLNLGLWVVTGKNLFGTMMIYFLLQAVGVQVERRFLKKHPLTNRFFTWLIVLVSVPLVFHESMLRTLHLWPK